MTRTFRALIVDDERLARQELRSLLAAHDCIDVVGEATNVASAAEKISELQPDVVFLDIQMPGESGFDLLNKIDVACDIIFATAFDEYAIRAFEVNALDYLLKPIHPNRLARAVARLSAREVASARRDRYDYSDMVLVRSGGRLRSFRICEIVVLQASGDYTDVLTSDDARVLVHKSMKEWERQLPDSHFCRIHRSMIVNLDHVDKFEESPKRHYWVHMKTGGEPLQISRRCAARLKRKLA